MKCKKEACKFCIKIKDMAYYPIGYEPINFSCRLQKLNNDNCTLSKNQYKKLFGEFKNGL